MKYCCVPTCKRKCISGVKKKYHTFPKDQLLRHQWTLALGVRNDLSKHATCCSDHFKMSDYTVTNYGDFPGQLRKGTVPSQNLPHSKSTTNESMALFPTVKIRTTFTLPMAPTTELEFVAVKEEPIDEDIKTFLKEPDVLMVKSSGEEITNSQVILPPKYASTTAKPEVRSFGTQTFINLRISYATISDSELLYATGLERRLFNVISHTLDKYAPLTENTVCVKNDSLLVTLFILRHGMNLIMAEFIFGFSRSILSGVCQDLVNKLHGLLKRENIWHKSFGDSKQFKFLLESTEKYLNRRK